jgi:hypothetical protein
MRASREISRSHTASGTIICDPDGRNGGGYIVGAKQRARTAVVPHPVQPADEGDTLVDVQPGERVTIRDVMRAACAVCAISRDQMCERSRQKRPRLARAAVYIVSRDDLGRSLTQIGKTVGRDHSTVLWGLRSGRTDPAVLAIANKVRAALAITPKGQP